MKNAQNHFRRIKFFAVPALLCIGLLLHSPARSQSNGPLPERPKYFCAHGKIISVDEGMAGAVIKHSEIEGFMGAMTMHFKAEDAEVLKGIKAGDTVRFSLKDTPNETLLVYVEKVAPPPTVRRKGKR